MIIDCQDSEQNDGKRIIYLRNTLMQKIGVCCDQIKSKQKLPFQIVQNTQGYFLD